jgi:DNA-binding transcriptional LysR family regulator
MDDNLAEGLLCDHHWFGIVDRLTSMGVFVRVADLGSFAAAAKELRLSPTMIGKHIRFLEERLGSLLLNRSTRQQGLTELGRTYLDHCRHILEEVEAGDALAEEALRIPRGRLRIAAPLAFGSYTLAPALVQFMKRYPEVTIELSLSDRMVDLVDEGIDAAVRVGPLSDSTMMARSLSPYRAVVCASPVSRRTGYPSASERSRQSRLSQLRRLEGRFTVGLYWTRGRNLRGGKNQISNR